MTLNVSWFACDCQYMLSWDPGFNYTGITSCTVCCSPLLSKQLLKNRGNVFGRYYVKLLAQLVGACPEQEMEVFSFLFWQFSGQQTIHVSNCEEHFGHLKPCFQIYLRSFWEGGLNVCVTWESASGLGWSQFTNPSCNWRVAVAAVNLSISVCRTAIFSLFLTDVIVKGNVKKRLPVQRNGVWKGCNREFHLSRSACTALFKMLFNPWAFFSNC